MNLIFVSAGLMRPKKKDTRVARRHHYLNYGLLSLASANAARDRSVFHGHFDTPQMTLDRILDVFDSVTPTALLLSCPSFLSLEWASGFIDLVRATFPRVHIFVGGRWVMDGNVDAISSILPGADDFVEGIGERVIGELLRTRLGIAYELSKPSVETFDQHSLSFLDYRKLDRPGEFVPSFEVSRGCGAGCAFCAEAKVRMTGMKPTKVLAREILDYRSAVPKAVDRFYLESSLFVPRRDWIDSWSRERQESGLEDTLWRTEGRVDMFAARNVEPLARAGLRVLDLGLESASATQLLRMRKTTAPEQYIRRCEELLREAKATGIMTKVNILLFPGENYRTLGETRDWLERNSEYITGLSVYPTVYYGFGRDRDPLWNYYESLGASIARADAGNGITMMDLSGEINLEKSEQIAEDLSSEYMSPEAYFKLKSFSYFDPSYSYQDYLSDLNEELT